jgi:riboflavin biosynthesis pyrimidine reductase
MTKPYIIVHMMTSIDGRIDCGMTAQMRGNDEYYAALSAIDCPNRMSGRVTAASELGGRQYHAQDQTPLGKESFAVNTTSDSYNVIVDTHGSLAWGDDSGNDWPHLVIASTSTPKEYFDFLNQQHVSWIATGQAQIDLKRAMEIAGEQFGIKRLAVVGGGHINGGMLAAGVVDEISLVVGPGIDGRAGATSVFDGMHKSNQPIQLKLQSVKTYDDGALWLRYLLR